MKTRALAVVAAASFVAGRARAIPDLVARWDFSQSRLEGNLCDKSSTPVQTLPANYPDLDPALEVWQCSVAAARSSLLRPSILGAATLEVAAPLCSR